MKLLKQDFAHSINIPRSAAQIIGILLYTRDPPASKFKKAFHKYLFIFLFWFLAIGVVGEVIDMVALFSVNFLAVTSVLPCICYCTVSLFKSTSIAYHLEKSEKLLADLEDLWLSVDVTESELVMIKENIETSRKTQKFFTMVNVVFGTTFNASSLIVLVVQYIKTGNVVKTLPYLIYMPWDTTGTYSYPLAYLYNIMSSSIAFTSLVCSDTFFIATIFHICTQFKLLRLKIQTIIEDIIPEDARCSIDVNHNYHQEMYRALIGCIKRHSELIKLSNTMEEIFSVSILLNLLNSSIIICCVGFNSTAVKGVDLAVFITFLIVGLYQIYILSWAGNQLIETSNAIADGAYNSSWYLTDKKYRQLIHIIILRAQRPQVVTGLQFSILSFKSFSSILSSSYSYFTLLQTSYQNK